MTAPLLRVVVADDERATRRVLTSRIEVVRRGAGGRRGRLGFASSSISSKDGAEQERVDAVIERTRQRLLTNQHSEDAQHQFLDHLGREIDECALCGLDLSDDFSAKVASDLCGKVEQLRPQYSMSESGQDARVSVLTGLSTAQRSSVTASRGYHVHRELVFEPKTFTELKNVQAIVLALGALAAVERGKLTANSRACAIVSR